MTNTLSAVAEDEGPLLAEELQRFDRQDGARRAVKILRDQRQIIQELDESIVSDAQDLPSMLRSASENPEIDFTSLMKALRRLVALPRLLLTAACRDPPHAQALDTWVSCHHLPLCRGLAVTNHLSGSCHS